MEGARARRQAVFIGRTQALNLVGAVLSFIYFRVIDPLASERPVEWADIAFFVCAVSLLGGLGVMIGIRLARPLLRPERHEPREVRRAAIMLPYTMAAIAIFGWTLAGILFGVFWPWVTGTLSMRSALRGLFGITVLGGGVTATFIFLSTERRWRSELPTFFPDGALSAVSNVLRLRVRLRLLAVFFLTSGVPLLLLAIVAYRRAALVAADPGRADTLLSQTLVVVVFLVVVGLWAAIGLSLFVANSVAVPLRELEALMGRVAGGDFDARAAVVSNDEIGSLAEGFNRMVAGLKERDFVKDTFGKYVTPEVRDEILGGRVGLEGEQREVTILFSLSRSTQ
jgi:HAMP domain-containing protein